MKTLYTAKAAATGRNGTGKTDDGSLSFNLSTPGSGKPGTNPEQLFAIGYAACFASAVELTAKQQKIDVGAVTVNSEVNLNQGDDGYSLSAVLNVSFEKPSGAEQSEALVAAAHQICPYSKATRGNISVELKVAGQALKAAA